jgi:glycosyltransferase involved in cell wall biosynthesis
MRILFLIDSLKRGGKERQLFELVRNVSTVHETYVITFSTEIEFNNIRNYVTELIILPRLKIGNISGIITLWKKIRTINPQIIHTWDHLSTLVSILPKLCYRIPLINGSIRYAFQMKRLSKLKILAKLGFLFSDTIVANSMAGLLTHNLKMNKKNVVIYNGFDFSRLHDSNKDSIIDPFIIKSNFKLCMVANFLPSKDHITLIKACNELTNIYPDVSIILIGDGPLRESMEALIPEDKKCHYIMPGRIDHVESIVNKCDVGILLCNTQGHAEGISNAIMEYMASGLPVIATNAGGTGEIVTDGKTGFLVPPFNSEIVTNKIAYFVTHEKERKIMGEQAKASIIHNFSIQHMFQKYTQLYSNYCK